MHYLHIIYSGIVEKTSNVGKKQMDVTEIRYIHPIWKENHILIEFPPMVANTKLRLQMNTLGCKSSGTVAKQSFIAK